jgi:hypothetical protein
MNNKQQTTLQEFIDIIKERKTNEDSIPFMWNGDIIKLAESFLEKEKEQLEQAYRQGVIDEVGEVLDFTTIECNYYEQTYGGNK